MQKIWLIGFTAVAVLFAQSALSCGERVNLETHDDTRSAYSLAGSKDAARAALVLLPGGRGYLDLDEMGRPRKLTSNSLVRIRGLLHSEGFVTALVDSPSDRQGKEGLGGFRIHPDHATNIENIIADIRALTGKPVWLIGASRGAISAVNSAAHLSGVEAPDGLILTSPVTSGREGGYKAWVAQSVFSVDSEAIRIPVLVIAHTRDKCVRTPPDLAGLIVEKTSGTREKTVKMSGGPGWSGRVSVKACRGKSPYGFIEQDFEIGSDMVQFIAGGKF